MTAKRTRRTSRSPVGAAPGTLRIDPQAPKPQIQVLAYGPASVEELADVAPDRLSALRGQHSVLWVDVHGLGDEETLRAIAACFSLHRLALEDVVNVNQRSKVEDYPEHLFVVARQLDAQAQEVATEQLSMFVGRDWVLTFQQTPGDGFEPVRARIRAGKGRLRHAGADYLAYALIDAVVDGYFPVLEAAGEALEELEDRVVTRPEPALLGQLYRTRRELVSLRRAIWPMREALAGLRRDELAFVQPETRLYLRDTADHAVQLLELLESYRELSASLVDVYLSSVSNRMNEVMKVLTVIATLFIPLTFVAGVYGMNFHDSPYAMPELTARYGYPATMGVMAVIAIGLIVWFRRRGWLGGRES